MNKLVTLLMTLLPLSAALAQDRIEMKGTSIIGNKELPKVLYIVPWKQAETIELSTPPFNSVLDDVLSPLERPAFQRQVRYYHDLHPAVENGSNRDE